MSFFLHLEPQQKLSLNRYRRQPPGGGFGELALSVYPIIQFH